MGLAAANEALGNEQGTAPTSDATRHSPMPAVNLPKGGGAIRGIGEKFGANPATGTGSMSVPIATSPGRSAFGPQLSLSYDSGAGNGPFGMGWNLSLPSITRKTDKGIPQYLDAQESDEFILSGVEDLVPVLVQDAGAWRLSTIAPRIVQGRTYAIKRYRPRVEGSFARIERWSNVADAADSFWRSITKDNLTTWYGASAESRIADPADSRRIYSWLICASHDDKGNVMVYEYAAEDSANVDTTQAHERNRTDLGRSANRHLKRIRYGNRAPFFSLPSAGPFAALPQEWLFEVVFDYGEHDSNVPAPEPITAWPCRPDAFSRYRAGFEIRNYRLCQRVLMFHWVSELGATACLVRSTDFTYSYEQNVADAANPVLSFLLAATQTGYRRKDDGEYLAKSLPPVEFEYSKPIIQTAVHDIDAESLQNLPYGIDGGRYQWLDLDGEGLSGVLSEEGEAWYYKPNLGPASPDQATTVRLGLSEPVMQKPSLAGGGAGSQFLDLAGDGHLDLVLLERTTPGFYERNAAAGWQSHIPFASNPVLDWRDANLRFVDLSGDGHADILITEDDALVWYRSLAEAGFAVGERVPKALDEESGPRLIFADAAQATYVADMNGDGLSEPVRIRNGEVCYWPNLGYGRFGAKVSMDRAPWFDQPDLFDQRRIRLADIDATGVVDILYLGASGIDVYFNQSGNSWSAAQHLEAFPAVDDVASIQVVDLMGNGTACLLWSSPLAGNAQRPMRYVDLMGQKPHLLVRMVNNLGAETLVRYAASTKFYLADKLAGKPWLTKIPFPVHVVERAETYDRISGNRFVTRYAYHHGYFDGVEREFRGFGMVEQWDTEEFAALNLSGTLPLATNEDPVSHVPPVHTKTWFHTGVYLARDHISDFYAGLLDANDIGEYYREPELSDADVRAQLLSDTLLPAGLTLEEEREATRALKGAMLRKEVYALDGSEKEAHPYTVTEQNFSIRLLQPEAGNRHAAFFSHPHEAIHRNYERDPDDPRTSHSLTLTVDDFGDVLASASIAYGRRAPDLTLSPDEQLEQAKLWVQYTENVYTNPIDADDDSRAPLACEGRMYELTGLELAPGQGRFEFEDVLDGAISATQIAYEAQPQEGVLQKRLLGHVRTLYRPNDMGQSRDDALALLPLGIVESLALLGENHQLIFTPGLLTLTYGEKASDAILENEGRYIHSEGDAGWWGTSDRIFLSLGREDDPATELEHARAHFFLPHRFRDRFHVAGFETESTVSYDGYDLLVQESVDALGNRNTVGERDVTGKLVRSGNDYRVLQAVLVMDPNRNRSAVAFDALGMVVGTAVMGKPEETSGDSLEGFEPDLDDAVIAAHLDDPLHDPHAILQLATTRFIHDLFRYSRSRDLPQPQPAVAYNLMRETHESDLQAEELTKIQHAFAYSDGFARQIQKKTQAEPGPLVEDGPEVSPRWVGSGWTVFNNKGKPVRRYEPFFTASHAFEFDLRVGVSPILFYDPLQRGIATLNPDHSWQKFVFNTWCKENWDVNDTVLIPDPRQDAEAGAFFARLSESEYLPTWHAARIDGALGVQEQNAALKTALHGETPLVEHADSLGRSFLGVVHNRFRSADALPDAEPVEAHYATRVLYDVEGKQRAVIDAKGRAVMRYDYDLLGNVIHSTSIDAGERWLLNDANGRALRAWDGRGHELRYEYDQLRRPLRQFVVGRDAVHSDPRVLNREVLFQKTEYGEGQSDDIAFNLRARAYKLYDGAGVQTSEAYDSKGNVSRATRQLAIDYKAVPDWNENVALQPERYSRATTYDALSRPISLVTPDGSEAKPGYNEANLLQKVEVRLRGALDWTRFVDDVNYNASGQRLRIAYGNGISTDYTYDPLTSRLLRLKATRDTDGDVQDLAYTYDPSGNVTEIVDGAQQTIFFANSAVTPNADYSYDAVYRLIEARGREHVGQTGQVEHDDPPLQPLPHPNDGEAMRRYTELYEYDEVGNLLATVHQATGGAWTRRYQYAPDSNRLLATSLPGDDPAGPYSATYTYDTHGSMSRMPHLPLLAWDFSEQLQASSAQVVKDGIAETTYYVYDAGGRRVRKVTERQAPSGTTSTRMKERLYIAGFELYREYASDGIGVSLERETLHVMDDARRIALIETKTVDAAAPIATPVPLQRFQLDNHLGSACVELDETGRTISYEDYRPYGSSAYRSTGSDSDFSFKRYRYSGKEKDEGTGFYYHGARYYACWLGRWTKADPVGIADGENVYAYAYNSPIVFVDPMGTSGRRPPPRAAVPPSVIIQSGPPPIPTIRYTPQSETYRNLRGGSGDWYREPAQTFVIGTGSQSSGSTAREASHQRVQSRYTETLRKEARTAFETGGQLSTTQRMQLLEYSQMGQDASLLGSALLGPQPGSIRTANAYIGRFAEYRAQGGSKNFLGWLGQQVAPGSGGAGHVLEVVVMRNGLPSLAGRVTSGAQGKHSISTWSDQFWTHTEAQFVRQNWSLMREGDVVVMIGQLPPCAGCRATMNHVDAAVGVEFQYRMVGSGGLWESEPNPSSRRAIANITYAPPSSQNRGGGGGSSAPAVMAPGLLSRLYSWWYGDDTGEESIPLPPRDPNGPVITNPR